MHSTNGSAPKRLIPMFPSVYRVVGAPQTPRQRAYAATQWSDGLVSHLTGANLLRFEAMPLAMWLDLTVARKTNLSAAGVVVHRSKMPALDRMIVDGIPCTSPSRTLIDCASLVGGETIEAAFEEARRMGLTSVEAIRKRLARGRAGSAVMRHVLDHADARPRESRLEVRFARLLRSSRLPEAQSQYEVGHYRVDFAWPDVRVVAECDGFAWHGNRLQWKQDRRRIATIEAAGWRVVHVTWDDVTKYGAETLARLALALRGAA